MFRGKFRGVQRYIQGFSEGSLQGFESFELAIRGSWEVFGESGGCVVCL